MVANMSDDDIWRLNRGGHDPHKVYNAYQAAVEHRGQPTVILAKTVKGYGMGSAGEGLNITHQQKKLDDEALKEFRNRFNIPVSDADIAEVPYYRPAEGSEELEYLQERRRSARWPPAAAAQARAEARRAGPRGVRAAARVHRRARDLHHHGAGAHPLDPPQGQGHRGARRADRARRGAHLRHGGPVPPDRHLLLDGAALHAAGRRPAALLS